MHPTIDAQLRGADRLIAKAESSAPLDEEAAELLTNARRLLAHVAKSWSELTPFHTGDNSVMTGILADLAPLVPDLQSEIDAATAPVPATVDITTIAERNARLRTLLSRMIRALPASSAGNEARARIGAYLIRRVETDPA